MSNVLNLPEGDYGVKFLQFNEGERVYVNDCEVPNLRVFRNQDDTVYLVYDRRFSTQDIPINEAQRLVSFLANCLAVASGFTHFSDEARRQYKFTTKSVGINTDNENI